MFVFINLQAISKSSEIRNRLLPFLSELIFMSGCRFILEQIFLYLPGLYL